MHFCDGGGGGGSFGDSLYNRDSGGAPCAKRASGAPWVSKSTHPRKFGNHVTIHRPSVHTTGKPMFNFTLSSSFGSIRKLILHTYCTSMLWSIDSCKSKVSADQYHLTVSRAEYFLKLSADKLKVLKWSQAQVFFLNSFKILIKNDFLKHKQANINVKSRRFGIIMTPFSRQNE